MHRVILRLATAIQLTRLTIAFGAVSDVWLIVLITRADARYSDLEAAHALLPLALLAGAIVAVGLFAYGAALNDVMDVRHDATFSPQRPIPAGRIRQGQAVVLMVGSLIVAVLAAAAFGTWGVCIALLTAAGLLFYNAAGKFIPAVGMTTIGLIHAAHMFIPNHEIVFLWPLWLVMTHAMVIAGAVHVLEDKRPRLSKRSIVVASIWWVFWTGVILSAMFMKTGSLWPTDTAIWHGVYPAVVVVAFVVIARWKTVRASREVAAEKLKRYAAMWQSLYCASWLLALDMLTEAGWMAAFAVLGFIVMTLIKELSSAAEKPLSYR